MKKVTVTASHTYDVLIGNGLLQQLGYYASQICPLGTAVIISDSNVWPIYGHVVVKSLTDMGIQPRHFVIEAGEASKNASNYLTILNFLAENKIARSDLLIALGGGVVGDLAGFTAATYLRGIRYMQVPTSLLAMVDSSVGGKTAIDLPAGKNLVGAFKQPNIVLCDISTLDTLPPDIFIDGCAEIIKYGILYDPELFEYLRATGTGFDREYVISMCVSLKAEVVRCDEFDTGLRQKLNLGHTIAHGIEVQSNFEISHGRAVAAGMAIITKASVANGLCSQTVLDSVNGILQKFNLPTGTSFSAEDLFLSALSDKKCAGGAVNLIIPRKIGTCEIYPCKVDHLQSFIEAGL